MKVVAQINLFLKYNHAKVIWKHIEGNLAAHRGYLEACGGKLETCGIDLELCGDGNLKTSGVI